jgi:transcriptional regulator with XRE-family HTH domain
MPAMTDEDGFVRTLGPKLKAIRLARGLSQRALARKAGVTNATISLIESGRMNPSVSALKRVLDGVPIGIAEFFAYEPEPEEQVFFAAEELTEIGKGGISYRQVGGALFARSLQILHETYQPGADTGRVMLTHAGEEGGVVISGRLEVTVGETRKILGPGDAYVFASTSPHRFRAVGPAPCVVVSACTPPTF